MIDDILSPQLKNAITATIQKQCRRFQEYDKKTRGLFYEPYTKTRQKYGLTAAVLSGFAPDRFKMDGVTVKDLQYGLRNQLFQPELRTDRAIIQVYSNGATPFNNKVVQEACKTCNGDGQDGPRFLVIQFHADKEGRLKKVEAIYPSESYKPLETKVLYQYTKRAVLPFVG